MHYSTNIQLYRKTTAVPFHQGERKNIHIFLTVSGSPNNGNGRKREGDKGTECKSSRLFVGARSFFVAPQCDLKSKTSFY